VLIVLGIGIAVLSRYLGAPYVFASEAFELDASVGRDLDSPDPATWQAALHGLDAYRLAHRYPEAWVVRADPSRGLIETNWYPVYKGEVIQKTRIRVWGKNFRVDSWQKTGWLLPTVRKTEGSRYAEIGIQEAVAAAHSSREHSLPSESPTSICELMAKPDAYHDQKVVLSADLVLGPHGGYLLDQRCNERGGLRLIVGDEAGKDARVTAMIRRAMQHHARIQVELVGTFELSAPNSSTGSVVLDRVLGSHG
jgi:hypothetical protein